MSTAASAGMSVAIAVITARWEISSLRKSHQLKASQAGGRSPAPEIELGRTEWPWLPLGRLGIRSTLCW